MGSLGIPEIMLILVIALLVFGPRRLPEIGRTLGKGLAEFRKASNELKRTINTELALDEDDQNRLSRRPDTPHSVSSMVQSWVADEPAKAAPALPAPRTEAPSEALAETDTITGTVARDAAPLAPVTTPPTAESPGHADAEAAIVSSTPSAPSEPT